MCSLLNVIWWVFIYFFLLWCALFMCGLLVRFVFLFPFSCCCCVCVVRFIRYVSAPCSFVSLTCSWFYSFSLFLSECASVCVCVTLCGCLYICLFEMFAFVFGFLDSGILGAVRMFLSMFADWVYVFSPSVNVSVSVYVSLCVVQHSIQNLLEKCKTQ